MEITKEKNDLKQVVTIVESIYEKHDSVEGIEIMAHKMTNIIEEIAEKEIRNREELVRSRN